MEQMAPSCIVLGESVRLTGLDLQLSDVILVSRGARVEISKEAEGLVKKARVAVEEAVLTKQVIYGINTGFGNNADVVLEDASAAETLQKYLILTHAVCVGKPLPNSVVRAMMVIRINSLLRGHSGLRWSLIDRLVELLNEDMLPVIPEKGSVGASGDLAPLSHMALTLIGEGEVTFKGQRVLCAEALGLLPSNQGKSKEEWAIRLGHKEGLALINGTSLMTAYAALSIAKLSSLTDLADTNAALCLEAICGRSAAFREDVHLLRPHPGQIVSAKNLRHLITGSSLVDVPTSLIPNGNGGWSCSPLKDESSYVGGKAPRPQDSYSVRCAPQVHGAVRDAISQAFRILEIELNSVTDNPLIFPNQELETRFASAGHFHGMPIAMALSYLKIAVPTLASISERRLNKLVDPATSDGLPPFLVRNLDGSESGFMIIQYTAASIVNDLATRAHPTTVYSVPTSANTEDHVSMGTSEGRHLLDMIDDLARVLALELMTATQALEVRQRICEGSYWPWDSSSESPEVDRRRKLLIEKKLRASPRALIILNTVREFIDFLDHDRALSADVQKICELVIEDPTRFYQAAFVSSV